MIQDSLREYAGLGRENRFLSSIFTDDLAAEPSVNWPGIQPFGTSKNAAESKDTAARLPEIAKRISAIMAMEHAPSAHVPLPDADP